MKVRIISLRDAVQRRLQAKTQLDSIGVDFEFFDAVKGDTGYRYFRHFDEKAYTLNTGRSIIPGEAGCYASHLLLWKECVELDEPILVLEDDFALTADFPNAINVASRLIAKCGFIRMEPHRRGGITVLQHGKFKLDFCTKYSHCTTAYMIHPDVAKVLIEFSQDLTAPVDVFLKFFWRHNQPLYVLSPETIMQSNLAHTTSSIVRAKKIESKVLIVRRAIYKMVNTFYRLRFVLNYRLKLMWGQQGRFIVAVDAQQDGKLV